MNDEPLRPRDLAVLLLASGDLLPRQRARDQQADRAGLTLKRHMLDRIAAFDPDPTALEGTLASIIEDFGVQSGPVRALALSFKEEWHAACAAPQWIAHLLAEATNCPPSHGKGGSGG